MKITKFGLYNAPSPNNPLLSFSDFLIGNIKLAKHLDIKGDIGVLSMGGDAVKQLLLMAPSPFVSGRVPLYVCSQCGDLGCGALTVCVERAEEGIIWRDFGYEGLGSERISQSEYMVRTGPFLFDEEEYRSVLFPYRKRFL